MDPTQAQWQGSGDEQKLSLSVEFRSDGTATISSGSLTQEASSPDETQQFLGEIVQHGYQQARQGA